jgi:hypothetical protein
VGAAVGASVGTSVGVSVGASVAQMSGVIEVLSPLYIHHSPIIISALGLVVHQLGSTKVNLSLVSKFIEGACASTAAPGKFPALVKVEPAALPLWRTA